MKSKPYSHLTVFSVFDKQPETRLAKFLKNIQI